MTLAAPPTTRDEDWRYADPVELAQLEPAALDAWKEVALAAGEVRCKDLVLGEGQGGKTPLVRSGVGAAQHRLARALEQID